MCTRDHTRGHVLLKSGTVSSQKFIKFHTFSNTVTFNNTIMLTAQQLFYFMAN